MHYIEFIGYSSVVYTKSICIRIFKKFGVEIYLRQDLIQLLGNVSIYNKLPFVFVVFTFLCI